MNKKKSFGSLIRTSRIKNGFGQRELATKIGVAASYLNDIEKEKRSAPKQIVIKKISYSLIVCLISSKEEGSSSVVKSPASLFSRTALIARLSNFPDLVFGSSLTK